MVCFVFHISESCVKVKWYENVTKSILSGINSASLDCKVSFQHVCFFFICFVSFHYFIIIAVVVVLIIVDVVVCMVSNQCP